MRTHSPPEPWATPFDPLCGWLDWFDAWHLAVGGVVLECVTNPPIPGVAVLFGLVFAATEWCDRFGNSTGHRACPYRILESCGAVSVDKRADLLEPLGHLTLASLKLSELRGLLTLRALLHGDVLFHGTESPLVVGDRHFEALDGFGVAGTVEHTTFQVTIE